MVKYNLYKYMRREAVTFFMHYAVAHFLCQLITITE